MRRGINKLAAERDGEKTNQRTGNFSVQASLQCAEVSVHCLDTCSNPIDPEVPSPMSVKFFDVILDQQIKDMSPRDKRRRSSEKRFSRRHAYAGLCISAFHCP